MISVFSKHLIERRRLIEQARLRCKVTNEYKVKECLENLTEDPGVFTCTSHPNYEVVDVSYLIAVNKSVRSLLHWVNNNVVIQAYTSTQSTLLVKLRIATCMLNNLTVNGEITTVENITIHDHMVANVLDLKRDLTEGDLPF